MRVFTIDFTTFTKGPSVSMTSNDGATENLGSTDRPLETLLFSHSKTAVDLIVIKRFKGDSNSEVVKIQLESRGFNVQELVVGGN